MNSKNDISNLDSNNELLKSHENIVIKDENIDCQNDETKPDLVDDIVQYWASQDVQFLDRTAIYLRLSRVYQHMHLLESTHLAKENGLNINELRVLMGIKRLSNGSYVPQSALLENIQVSPSGLSKQIDRLKNKGYIERTTDEEDRRSVLLGLTNKGLDFLCNISSNQEFSKGIDILDKEEQRILNHLLKKILVPLEKEMRDMKNSK